MKLKEGDSIYCKKSVHYNTERFCIAGVKYEVGTVRKGVYSLYPINNDRIRYGIVFSKFEDNGKHEFIWDYFETKKERGKRIIENFNNENICVK